MPPILGWSVCNCNEGQICQHLSSLNTALTKPDRYDCFQISMSAYPTLVFTANAWMVSTGLTVHVILAILGRYVTKV